MKECINYKKIETSEVVCGACHHFCRISEGNVGVCGIRQNFFGKLYLLTYGKTISANIDPIEKKPLFHFLPGSKSYSIATFGCNFRCANCQNYDISQMLGYKGKAKDYEKLNWGLSMEPKQVVQKAIENNCQSISYTYNEPTVFLEYALDTMKIAREKGIKNVWVSNGYMSNQTMDVIIPYLDAINVDIKSFSEDFYKKNCGASLAPVLENCKRFAREKVWLEITTLVIPGFSDNEKILKDISEYIKKELGDFVPWHVISFYGMLSWKMKNISDTAPEMIKKAYEIGKKSGLKFVYAGNIIDPKMENTYCPECKNKMIKRINYSLEIKGDIGKCTNCGKVIPGVFK